MTYYPNAYAMLGRAAESEIRTTGPDSMELSLWSDPENKLAGLILSASDMRKTLARFAQRMGCKLIDSATNIEVQVE